jgi:hypothetical protein
MPDKRREIDWASAEVHERSVVIGLTGKSSKAWNDSFDGVLHLLGHGTGGWREIGHDKKTIKVQGLQPKAERDLRHFLEAVVVQVNAELAESESESEPEPGAEPTDQQELEDEAMAATLRSFGESQADDPHAT